MADAIRHPRDDLVPGHTECHDLIVVFADQPQGNHRFVEGGGVRKIANNSL
jgi:hypothetical protein